MAARPDAPQWRLRVPLIRQCSRERPAPRLCGAWPISLGIPWPPSGRFVLRVLCVWRCRRGAGGTLPSSRRQARSPRRPRRRSAAAAALAGPFPARAPGPEIWSFSRAAMTGGTETAASRGGEVRRPRGALVGAVAFRFRRSSCRATDRFRGLAHWRSPTSSRLASDSRRIVRFFTSMPSRVVSMTRLWVTSK